MYNWTLVQIGVPPQSVIHVDLYTEQEQAYLAAFERVERAMQSLSAAQLQILTPAVQQEIEDVRTQLEDGYSENISQALDSWEGVAHQMGQNKYIVTRPQGHPPTTLAALADEAAEEVRNYLAADPDADFYMLADEAVAQIGPSDNGLWAMFWHETPSVDLAEAASRLEEGDIGDIMQYSLGEHIRHEVNNREDEIRASIAPVEVTSQQVRKGTEKDISAALHIFSIFRRQLWSTPEPIITEYPSFGDTVIMWPMVTDASTVLQLGHQLEPCPGIGFNPGEASWNPSWAHLVNDPPRNGLLGFVWRLACNWMDDISYTRIRNVPAWWEEYPQEEFYYRASDDEEEEDEDTGVPLVSRQYSIDPVRPENEVETVEISFQLLDRVTKRPTSTYVRIPVLVEQAVTLNHWFTNGVIVPPTLLA